MHVWVRNELRDERFKDPEFKHQLTSDFSFFSLIISSACSPGCEMTIPLCSNPAILLSAPLSTDAYFTMLRASRVTCREFTRLDVPAYFLQPCNHSRTSPREEKSHSLLLFMTAAVLKYLCFLSPLPSWMHSTFGADFRKRNSFFPASSLGSCQPTRGPRCEHNAACGQSSIC